MLKEELDILKRAEKALSVADDELDSCGYDHRHFIRRLIRDSIQDLHSLLHEEKKP